MDINISGNIFKQFRDTKYFVSKNGEVYSSYSNKILKPLLRTSRGKSIYYIDIFNKNINKQQHIPIQKLVYESWISEIPNNLQINHINDNSLDNRLENLYIGDQKQNIQDCINNNHRVGNIYKLKLYDNFTDEIYIFIPASNFLNYIGLNGTSVSKQFNRNWFDLRYTILEYEKIKDLSEYNTYKV